MRFIPVLVVAGLCGALGACSSTPSYGDKIVSEGRGTAAIGEKWNEGSEMVAKGTKLQQRGRDEIKDGQSDIAAGQDLITRGRAQMAEAERENRLRAK
jgi:hypothetical protein